jgi:UDP-N-acetyl-D-galactosamine dehydrogenase
MSACRLPWPSARRGPVIGYDIDPGRIAALERGQDATREVDPAELAAAEVRFTADLEALRRLYLRRRWMPRRPRTWGPCWPPPAASGTVYPGATEEDCVPVLEAVSGLTFNRDFFVGYSPERINPGDKAHRLTTIVKVTAGSTPEAADFVDALYAGSCRPAPTKAPRSASPRPPR